MPPQTTTALPSGHHQQVQTYLRLVTHFQFLVVGPDQNMVTKRHYNWSPGLILDVFCTIFRARPVGKGLGAEFGWKPAKNQIQIIILSTYSKRIKPQGISEGKRR